MKLISALLSLLIIAPVSSVYAASANDDVAFMEKYMPWRDAREAETNKPHNAKFAGRFTFKEVVCLSGSAAVGGMGRSGGLGTASSSECECPKGNKYLQCLTSATAIIQADPVDVGGKGIVMVQASHGSSTAVLIRGNRLQGDQWVSPTQFRNGAQSAVLDPIQPVQEVAIPVPDQETISQACSAAGGKVKLKVGYGAVMPMDIEYAARTKANADERGLTFDEPGFLWSRARINGFEPKKIAKIGTIECRPLFGGI